MTIEPIGIDDAFWSTSNSLLKNLEIGSLLVAFGDRVIAITMHGEAVN